MTLIWITNNHVNPRPKGLGVLTFNDFSLEVQPRDEDMEIFIPLKICKVGFSFNLLAVWNFYYACKQGRFKGVRGDNCLEWSALKHFGPKLSSPSLMVGDWNFGRTCFSFSIRSSANSFIWLSKSIILINRPVPLKLSSLASHNSLYNGCLVSTGVTNVSQSSHQQTGLGIATRSSLSSTIQASLFSLTSMLSKMLYPRHS